MSIYAPLLLVFIWTLRCCNASSNTLQMVNLVYRHGARSPLFAYPNDQYQLKDWHGGPGRLTQVGKRLEYDLGKFLRSRYVTKKKFLGRRFVHDEVYVQSSDVDRCLESAETQLAGLYPPEGFQVWNKEIPWQPVPIHSKPKNADPVLRSSGDHCPKREKLFSEKKKEPAYIYKLSHSQTLLLKLSNYTGMDVDFGNLFHVTDAILSEKSQGWDQPKWVIDLWDEMISLSDWIFLTRYRGNHELGRILGGPLLQKIISNMKVFTEKTSVLPKMNIFSAHDSTLLSLAAGLDINITRPIFASCIMVELYTAHPGSYYVEIYFRNDYSGNLYPLKLKNCNFSCPLDDLIKLTRKRVSNDRNVECGIRMSPHFYSIFHLKTLVLTSFIVCLFSFIFLIVMFCKRKRSFSMRIRYHGNEEGEEEEEEHLI